MVASLENHQRNVKKSSYPTKMIYLKGDFKKIFRVTFCIFLSFVSLFSVLFAFYTVSHILLSPYRNVLTRSCFMVRWKAGTNFPLQFLVGVYSSESAKPSSFQQHWLVQFECISFPCMNCITNMQKVSSLKQGILTVRFNSFLHFASKWQITVDASLHSHI